MKKFIQKLCVYLLGEDHQTYQLSELRVDLVRDNLKILKEVRRCKQSGGLIGIYSRMLGSGMCLTRVEDICEFGKETVVILNPLEVMGFMPEKNSIPLSEIRFVCPFNQVYEEAIPGVFPRREEEVFAM